MIRWAGHEVRLFLVALQFLTRVPVPSFDAFEPSWLDRSAKYFPVVGLVVGGLTAAVVWITSAVWPMAIAAVLAVGAGIALTGAFHEDGLADTADGLGGGLTPQRRLDIMKDSRIGTYGAAVLLVAVLLRIACVASLAPLAAAMALVAAHTAARLPPLVVMRCLPYVGNAGTAKPKPLATSLGLGELMFAGFIALATLFSMLDLARAIGAVILTVISVCFVARLARRLIGGYTGDVLGACEQMAEIAILLAAATFFGKID